ncbi:MAG: hypothetical protein R3D67_20175 [Hyphomicrobiaceae bacterium]
MAHITSAGFGTAHPFRPVGLALIAAALAAVAYTFIVGGTGAFALSNAGSPLLWVAFGAAGVGLFLSVFARRYLIVRTVDGARTKLRAGDEDASALVISRIRNAMEANHATAATTPQPRAQSLETAASPPLAIANEPSIQIRTTPTERSPPAASHQIAPRATPSATTPTQPLSHLRRPDVYTNGHDHTPATTADPFQVPAATSEPKRYQPAQYLPSRATAGTGAERQSLPAAHAEHAKAAEPLAAPAHAPLTVPAPTQITPPRDDPAKDLQALIEHVRRADLQHKEALLDLLRVVDDHFRGRANREDAQAHWRSFADYVMQYLSDVDGLLEATERFGRHMVAR